MGTWAGKRRGRKDAPILPQPPGKRNATGQTGADSGAVIRLARN